MWRLKHKCCMARKYMLTSHDNQGQKWWTSQTRWLSSGTKVPDSCSGGHEIESRQCLNLVIQNWFDIVAGALNLEIITINAEFEFAKVKKTIYSNLRAGIKSRCILRISGITGFSFFSFLKCKSQRFGGGGKSSREDVTKKKVCISLTTTFLLRYSFVPVNNF